jgi:pimeloyl-ACP methyl ester carboxylesterase
MNKSRALLFLHGFASSARTTKALYLSKQMERFAQVAFHALDFNPTPTDFEYMTTTGLVNRVRQYVLDHDLAPLSIIGSSYGGLVAFHYAHRYPGVERMLLLAPAVHWLSGRLSEQELARWQEAVTAPVHHYAFDRKLPVRYDLEIDGLNYLEPVPPAAPTLIIHGNRDTTVPTDDSRAYAAQHPELVQLIEVDADHDLNDHLPLIWKHLQAFLLDVKEGDS